MKYAKEIFTKHGVMISFYLAAGIAIAFLENLGIRLFQNVIDTFTAGTMTILTPLIYGGVLLLTYGISYLDNYPQSKLERELFLHFKLKALKKTASMDYQAYQTLGTGNLVQRIEAGSAAGKNMLCGFWFRLLRELLPSVLFSIFFISQISLPITYAVLLGYGVVFLVSNLLLKSLYRIKAKILDNEEKLNHWLIRGFMEMVVFRVNRRFQGEIEKAVGAKKEIVGAKVKMTLLHEAFFAIFAILITLIKVGLILNTN